MRKNNIAVLYQGHQPPAVGGVLKPMKPNGYLDSSADIAYTLSKLPQTKWQVITPTTTTTTPSPTNDSDWSFPDTAEGIQKAVEAGATVLWANTVLYAGHPIAAALQAHTRDKPQPVAAVCQHPNEVQLYDDKDYTNKLLQKHNIRVPTSFLISFSPIHQPTTDDIVIGVDKLEKNNLHDMGLEFPVVIKPIRGRGSQGVAKIESFEDLVAAAKKLFDEKVYGDTVMVEEYLPGEEITVAVFPPGHYTNVSGVAEVPKDSYWAVEPVIRRNHHNGIAPYNGVVAVVQNSALLDRGAHSKEFVTEIDNVLRQCEEAAKIVNARAPIRIDCRFSKNGKGVLFDLNMKPNMTGPGRPGREDQDSLVGIAVRSIGWDFSNLVDNIASQYWFF